MTSQNAVAGLIAILVVGGIVGSILYSTRHNKVELNGNILKVRTHQIDPENTVVFADVRVNNPSTQQFVVQEVQMVMEDASGKTIEGETFSDLDAKRLFDYYPVLGKKYNQNLMIRQKINSNESIDRMISVKFPGTEEQVQKRKGFKIIVTDVDGAKTEMAEKLQ